MELSFPLHSAPVSEEDFNALKETVRQLGDKVQKLEQTHQQDERTHEQDQQRINQLQQQVGRAQELATNAVEKAEAAQAQPIHAIPEPTMNATHNFTLAGDAEVQYGKFGSQHGGFALADFAPLFLYRGNDSVLFEAGFDTTLASDGSHFDLSFAQLDYLMNDYVTVVGGDMILPLGVYNERSAGWLNKFPDAPLPYTDGVVPNVGAMLPGSGVGAQLRGALPIGDNGQMATYAIYGVNGPASLYGNGNFTGVALSGANVQFPSLNPAPSAGGRIGWFLPLKPHYDLELGVSGLSGERVDYGPGSLQWSGLVADATLHVSPFVEVKGEYIRTWLDSTDIGYIQPHGWWVQAGYKLAGLGLEFPVINNVEPVFRYDAANDGQGNEMDRYSAGFVYYITNTLLFEGDYEIMHDVPADATFGSHADHGFIVQLSYGF